MNINYLSPELEEEIEKSEEDPSSENETEKYNKKNILLCPNPRCKSIPEIYFDEKTLSIYLFCEKKHKNYLALKKYINKNNETSDTKLKDEDEKQFQEINADLNDETNQQIEDMKNRIKLQKKYLQILSTEFNNLIFKLKNDFSYLYENRLTILSLQEKIIYTYLKHHKNKNAAKNFQNLTNFIQHLPIPNGNILNNDEKNAYSNNALKQNDLNDNLSNYKNIFDRIKFIEKIFDYFDETSHNLMTQNKIKNIKNNEINNMNINNLCVLNSGNLCFSSDTGNAFIYRYNENKQKFDLINNIVVQRPSPPVKYVTQLSNGLLVCCSNKIFIGKLSEDETKYETIQIIENPCNNIILYYIPKIIELENNFLVSFDLSPQITVYKQIDSKNNNNSDNILFSQYEIYLNSINKGESINTILSLPYSSFSKDDYQFISTSNDITEGGKGCIRFYSSLNDYQNFETIYNINSTENNDSLLMINKKILCIGIKMWPRTDVNYGVALVDITTRQVVTVIESESFLFLYKLKNELIVTGSNKVIYKEGEPNVEKQINFYFVNDENGKKCNELMHIGSINSGIKHNVKTFGELNYNGELIMTGSSSFEVYQ